MGYISSSSSPSFWQSNLWRDILIDSRQAHYAQMFSYGAESLLIEFRSIGMGMIGAFSLGIDLSLYTPGFLEKCSEYVAENGAILYQIEEYLPKGKIEEDSPIQTYGKAFLEPWTRILDLTKTEEELLANMHEKCRYNIKLAWKRGVRVTWADPTKDHIDMWMELLTETTGRDGFSQNSREYYVSFLQMLRDTKTGGLLFAGYNGRIIAAGIYVYYHNTALYYYGASTSDGELRKHMAPYMLQWEAIREGKLRGCQTYDFLGIAPPGDIGHSLAGVTNFKEKFGGEMITIGSKKLFIVRPIRYAVFLVFRFLKNSIRNLSLRIFSK